MAEAEAEAATEAETATEAEAATAAEAEALTETAALTSTERQTDNAYLGENMCVFMACVFNAPLGGEARRGGRRQERQQQQQQPPNEPARTLYWQDEACAQNPHFRVDTFPGNCALGCFAGSNYCRYVLGLRLESERSERTVVTFNEYTYSA